MTIKLVNQKVEKDNEGEYVIVKIYNQDIKDLNTMITSFVNRRDADNLPDDNVDVRARSLKDKINELRKFMNPS